MEPNGTLERAPRFEISVKVDTILPSSPQTVCVFCGRRSSRREHRGRIVCRSCVAELTSTR